MTQEYFDISGGGKNRRPEPAAIIGLSCFFPGAENLAAYWTAIKNRRDAIGDIPPDHWRVTDYYDPDPKAEDKTYGRRGGFLAPVEFEPLKYGIVPNDLAAIDTTQILGLVAADRALADAGYPSGNRYNHSRTAVMLGVTGALKMVVSLGSRLAHPQLKLALADSGVDTATAAEVLKRFAAEFAPWQESSFPGLLGNVTAGRIANRLNLGGANLVTDAACASSLAALRQSLMELGSGQADLVVTGGLDTFSDPFMYTCFSKTPALSPTGDVRAYDCNGDGTILGEGIGILVLKRLSEARRDGDRIYAIVHSVGSASDGKGAAIFAPSADGQVRALNNAYETAEVNPAEVGLIEGHGTGTAVGDTVEVEALNRVFRQNQPDKPCRPWCALGSVKSQIGHTKAAAGVAGVIKAALALYRKVLPPSAKVNNPLPLLTEPGSPFYLTSRPRPWITNGPRRAGVSAFGFGGSNFHAVLEENSPQKPETEMQESFDLFTFSGEHSADVAAALAKAAKAGNQARAAARSRAAFSATHPCRLIIIAGESFHALAHEVVSILTRPGFIAEDLPEGVLFGRGQAAHSAYGYLRPGADHVHQWLFGELAVDWPPLLEALNEEAGRLAQTAPNLPPLDLCLYPPDLSSPDCRRIWAEAFEDRRVRRAAAKALTAGLEKIFERFGLKPSAVIDGLDEPDTLIQNLNRKGAQQVSLWLELAPAESIAPSVRAAGREVLTYDGGRGGSLDLARFLGRLAAMGLAVNFTAWPTLPDEEAAGEKSPRSFTVKISGANQFTGPERPPARPAKAAAPAGDRSTLIALEAMTAETSRLHQEFLTQQSEALRLMRRSLEIDSAAPDCSISTESSPPVRPATPITADRSAAAPETAPAAVDLVLQVIAEETGYPAEMLNLEMDLEDDLGLDSIKKVEIMATLSERLPDVQGLGAETINGVSTLSQLVKLVEPTQSMPAPASPVDGRSPDVWPLLLEVVGTETGYPPDMLRPDQSLVDDLGLDSIKLVEIASLMAEKLPEAPAMTADVLHGTATLGQLAEALKTSWPTAVNASLPSPEPAAARPPANRSGGTADSRVETILEIVAGETGYPRDMLNLSMHLEGDLGLDSIKKVEIMAAVSERLPELETLSTAEAMAGLETLGDLANMAGKAVPAESLIAVPVQTSSPPVMGHRLSAHSSAPAAPAAIPVRPAEIRAAKASADDLLLDVVAAETGYPRDMLSFEASLEADLGLDSIKRVEIMAALSERTGDDNLAASSTEIISQARTLGDLRDIIARNLPAGAAPARPDGGGQVAIAVTDAKEVRKRGPGRPPKNSPPAFKDTGPGDLPLQTVSVTPFRVEMVPVPLTIGENLSPGLTPGARVLIVADSNEVAAQLENLFGDPGRTVVKANWAMAEASAADPRLESLILVWPGDLNDLDRPRQAFRILKTAGPALLAGPGQGRAPLVMGLTFMGGQFGLSSHGPAPAPASASLTGLLKSAAREWPGVRVRAMDLPLGAYTTDISGFLPGLAVACEAEAPMEMGLAARDQLMTPHLAPYKLKNIRVRHVREGQTLLVTGGARGVTAAALKELAKSFRPRLVIMGRTPLTGEEPKWLRDKTEAAAIRQAIFDRAAGGSKPNPRELAAQSARILAEREIKANLSALEKAGSKVTYISGDFMNESSLNAALDEIKKTHGPVCGFIHGAGVLADSLLVEKKEEDFCLVFDTKARMASRILTRLEEEPLNFVAFFSSSTARFGRRGQGDYAAGNEVLNKLARSLSTSRQGPKCLSVNWGPWAGGMVDTSLSRLFENEGIGLIPLAEGARLFAALAGAPKNDPVEVVVLGPQTDLSCI